MKKNSIGLPVISAMAIAMGLGGCADENPWGNTSSQTGSINLTLTTDYEFDTAKPVFRSGEGETGKKVKLSEYTSVPSAEAFQIKLENTKGYSHEWRSLTAFNADESIKGLATGLYTITAYYGAMATTGEDRPYFEAKSSFTVLPNKTSEVELNAELKNSMVYIDYTADFLAYMSSFTTTLSTKGSTQIASNTYNKEHPLPEKTKAIFIEPKEVKVDVSFTTKETGKTASVNIGTFAALAKTLHRMTLDINHKNNGFATLSVTFDEKTGSETVDVDLTEQLFATEAPTITFTGSNSGTEVSSGATIDMSADNKMAFSVFVPGGLQTATLTVKPSNSDDNHAEVIDLMDITETELASKNIKANGFNGKIEESGNIATLDITEYAKGLSSGDYSVKLDVKDKSNRTASFQLYANTEQVEAKLAKDGDNNLTRDIVYASGSTELILDYNGNDYQELTFKASGASGTLEDVTADYVKSEMLSTRGYENRRCHYNVTLPYSKKTKVNFEVYNKTGKQISKFEVPVAVPEYTISDVDAFSRYAYMKIDATDASQLKTIIDNIGFEGISSSDIIRNVGENGVIVIKSLTPALSYTLKHSITDTYTSTAPTFITEDEATVPNGDFENLTETINTTINQGGTWTITAAGKKHTTTLTMKIKEPTGWTSSNATTCNLSAKNQNSWYVIPSVFNTSLTWQSNQPTAKVGIFGQDAYTSTADVYKNLKAQTGNTAIVIRNVAWDHDGSVIENKGQTGNSDYSNYFCSNKPSSIANRSAGYLKLEGASFNSRPTSLKGHYKYATDSQDKTEKGTVSLRIMSGQEEIGSGSIELVEQAEYGEFTLPIKYISNIFNKKATSLYITISSSNKTTDIKTTDYCNKDECCSRGASLTVDNFTFEYSTSPK